MSLLRRVVSEVRAASLSSFQDPRYTPRGMGSFWAGVPVTDISALQHITVLACVGLLADTISSLPVGAFREEGEARIPVTPKPQLLEKPHPELHLPAWLSQGVVSLAMRGNFYGRIVEWGGKGRDIWPSAIKVIHPDDVTVKRDKSSGQIQYKLRGEKEKMTAFPGEIVHALGLTLPGGIVGIGPVEYARQAIGTSLATDEFAARFFGDGATPSSVLTSERPISDVTAQAVQERILENHGQRRRLPMVLGGGLQYKAISLTPNESQFLETRKFQVEDIARLWRIPPHMVGETDRSTSWGKGIEEQALGFVTFTLAPWLVRLEATLSELLPQGQYVRFNVAGLLRGRTLDRFNAYLMGRNGGWLSINDIRRLEDMAPITEEGADNHLQPLNYVPIEQTPALDPTKPPAPEPDPAEEPAA